MMDDEFEQLMPAIKDFPNDLNLLAMTPLQQPNQQQQQQQHIIMNTSADFNQLDEILGGGRALLSNAGTNVYAANNVGTNNQFAAFQGEMGHVERPPFFPLFNSIPQQQQQQTLTQPQPQQQLSLSKPVIDNNDYSASIPAPVSAPSATNTNTNRRKRKYVSDDEEPTDNETNSTSNSTTLSGSKPSTSSSGDDTKHPGPLALSAEGVIIDQNMLIQLGGLAYAELCKERAREAFKEAKKNEHLAKGNFDRMKRRKKGDTSMTPREKYVRRLRMNQDSAAAARHAQEVYVSVLERLVRTSEAEKKSFIAEVHQVRVNSDHYKSKSDGLSSKVKQLEKENAYLRSQQQQQKKTDEHSNHQDGLDGGKKYDPALAKYLDLFKDVATVGANPDIGVQPARAV